MELNLSLFDSYHWFAEVISLPIAEAGLCLFSRLGYVDDAASPLLSAKPARSFVYSLLPEGRILSDTDRYFMQSLRLGSLLFQLRSQDYPEASDDINVYAVDMEDVDYARSEVAYGIHCLIAKFSDSRCIVLFRHRDAILLSFLYPLDETHMSIYLSDWLTLDTPDNRQFERMHIASTSLRSARECCDGLAFEAIRDYYKYSLGSASLWYAYMDTVNTDQVEYDVSPREEAFEYATASKSYYVDLYGDDYVEDKINETDSDNDFKMDDIEWGLQTAEELPDDLVADDSRAISDPSFEESYSATDDIPAEVMADPIALLDWINTHQASTSSSVGSALQMRHTNDDVDSFHEVPWTTNLLGIEPKVGSWIRHQSLGNGIVTRVGNGDFSATFGDQRKLFIYPYVFEKGITFLLHKD